MGLPEIRDAITSILQGADPASTVHDFERWEDNPEKIAALFQKEKGGRFSGWVFKPTGRSEELISRSSTRVTYPVELRFIRSVIDSEGSEKRVWDEHLEPAVHAFRSDLSLGGAAWSTGPVGGGSEYALQVGSVEYVRIGSVFCHFAKCRLNVHVKECIAA